MESIKAGGTVMRLDKFLKVSRLIKRRTLAKEIPTKAGSQSTDLSQKQAVRLQSGMK